MAVVIANGGLQSVKETKVTTDPYESEKAQCKAKGGTWDSEDNVCILPDPGQTKEVQTKVPVGTVHPAAGTIETSAKLGTGEKGITTIPDGRSFMGLNKEDLKLLAAQQAEGASLQTAIAPNVLSRGTAQAQADTQAEIAQLTAEETPQRRELDPQIAEGTLGISEATPVLGPLATILAKPLRRLFGKKAVNIEGLTPETLRTVALTEIEKREIDAGLTQSERFGELVEAVPAGELAKYIPGFGDAEKPSDNVQTIVKTLRTFKTRATDIESKYNKGLLTKSQARNRIDLIENELQAGESRMKLLIQNSPELKFNSDGVNFIESKILEVRERIFDAKLTTAGPQGIPTDEDLLSTLQETEEDYEIPGL